MKYFPTLIVDDFLKDPIVVMDYANTLEYSYPKDYRYPGLRTDCLSNINFDLFNHIGNLILSCYRINDNFTWNASASFQIIDGKYSEGWIHSDAPHILTSIIYLSDNVNSGTSMYKNTVFWQNTKNEDIKRTYYKKMAENKCYEINDSEIIAVKQNNNPFYETVNIKALFNRMISFEASEYHGANNIDDLSGENIRLTLVYFFNEINVHKNLYPLHKI